MILKPFMLRRIKVDVENELTEKLEVLVYCPLTIRQKHLYSGLKRKIRIEELLQGYGGGSQSSQHSLLTTSLMNLVMQFRKVIIHFQSP
jgi:DNA helicase INO80